MKTKSFQIGLAPEKLWQSILPWRFFEGAHFGLLNIDLGQTPRPDIEAEVLDDVGSYGRQIGRIGDALEVLFRHVKLENLDVAERDAIVALQNQLAEVRRVKARSARGPAT